MGKATKGFVITLEEDIKEEVVDSLVSAISLIRGIASVKPIESDYNDQMNRETIRYEFRSKFIEFYNDELKDQSNGRNKNRNKNFQNKISM